MLIVYASSTGNVKRFVNKLTFPSIEITEGLHIEEPYILITYTTGFGQVPDEVKSFLKENCSYIKGVAASGNKNWGGYFARSGDLIALQYQVPVLHKFELSGLPRDVEIFKKRVEEFK